MKPKLYVLFAFLLLSCRFVQAQQQPNDPIGETLFPPELVMQHQQGTPGPAARHMQPRARGLDGGIGPGHTGHTLPPCSRNGCNRPEGSQTAGAVVR